MALTTTTNSGSQGGTESPQTAGASNIGASSSTGGVQPGTSSIINQSGSGGVALHDTPLTTVSLTNTATSQAQPIPAKHHVNPALFGISAVLLLIAIGLFWLTSRSEKITT